MGIFELELWLTCRSHLGVRFSFSEWKTSASEEHANSRLKNRSAQFDPYPGNTVISAIVHTPVGCVLYHIFASNIHHFDPSPSTILKDFRASQVWSTSFGPFTSYFYCSIPIEKTYARSLVLKQASWGLRLANDNGVTLLRLASFQCMMASQKSVCKKVKIGYPAMERIGWWMLKKIGEWQKMRDPKFVDLWFHLSSQAVWPDPDGLGKSVCVGVGIHFWQKRHWLKGTPSKKLRHSLGFFSVDGNATTAHQGPHGKQQMGGVSA